MAKKRLKQPHTRAKFNKPTTQTTADFSAILSASISTTSHGTYDAALNTLTKFLRVQRACDSHHPLNPVTCTEDELTQFLVSLSQQKMAAPDTYRCALLHAQRVQGCDEFAAKKKFILACKGIRNNHVKSIKGVITLEQLQSLVISIENSTQYFIPTCTKCKHYTKNDFNKRLSLWIQLQFLAQLRPGELKTLETDDITKTTQRTRNGKTVETNSLLFRCRKNEQGGGLYPIPDAVFHQLLISRDKNGMFLVPRCADTHIGAALSRGATIFKWNKKLVWVAHALRHTVFTILENQIQTAVDEFVSNISSPVFRGTYTKPR